ncbi:MAG: putative addiction module antidote protein [Alphaproteobacteria bacterium]|nr:putative addiction module antidote protein [Alphaproteobacteria bacterium]MBV8407037.1 putative addiction module antidote protein [Alphaproteobacteria bacterium]
MGKRKTGKGIRLTKFDPVDYLNTEQDMALYLEACLHEAGDDPAFIAAALGNVARARGIAKLARKTGMTRAGLYKAFSKEGNPSFAAVLKAIRAMGLEFHISPQK